MCSQNTHRQLSRSQTQQKLNAKSSNIHSEVHDGQRGGGRSSRFLKFKQPCFPGSGSTGSASPVEEQQSEERRIPKLKAGRNYFLKLRADYGKEGAIESDEFHLYTQPYEGI